MRYNIVKYDYKKYNFDELIKNLFKVGNLSCLDESFDELFRIGDDSKTIYHKIFYDKYRNGWPEFEYLYLSFIENVVGNLYLKSFLYQKFPTFRVHLKNNVAVGGFHKDIDFGHPSGEINYIIPLTNSIGTATVWVESKPGRKDFEPISMVKGNLIEFNGNELTHGNKVNMTGLTRVSLDFRVLPLKAYQENKYAGESITQKTKFVLGEYYRLFKV